MGSETRYLAFSAGLFLIVFQARAQLVPDWSRVHTDHFELISRYDPAKTGPLLLDLEWARAVLAANLQLKPETDRKVLVLVPDSVFEYEQVSPSKYSAGYYLGAPWRDIIVLRDLHGARHSLFHEYTHLVLQHQGGSWPAWFNEGTAEFYATMSPTKQGVEAGRHEPTRTEVLRKGAWVPISYLFTLDTSFNLPSADAVNRFYAQSWLYVHMLHLSGAYRDRFQDFRELLSGGLSTEDALRRVYSKSANQFDNEARDWFLQKRLPMDLYPAPAPVSSKVDVKPAGQLNYEIVRATVAASGAAKNADRDEYPSLARRAAGQCALQAPLGDLAFAAHLFREAASHYQEAIRCGGDAAGLAQGLELTLGYREKIPTQELEPVAAVTGGSRSRYLMGRNRFFTNDYEGALSEFAKVKELPESQKFQMVRLQALSLARLQRFSEAEEAAGRLAELARNEEQRQSAQLTRDDVQRERQAIENPPESPDRLLHKSILNGLARLEGEVIRVDCLGAGARFWVRSGAETRKVIIADPAEVVTGPEADTPLEFSCGQQRRGVLIGYKPRPDSDTDTVGRIRYIEFR
jgi:hypothetical protein